MLSIRTHVLQPRVFCIQSEACAHKHVHVSMPLLSHTFDTTKPSREWLGFGFTIVADVHYDDTSTTDVKWYARRSFYSKFVRYIPIRPAPFAVRKEHCIYTQLLCVYHYVHEDMLEDGSACRLISSAHARVARRNTFSVLRIGLLSNSNSNKAKQVRSLHKKCGVCSAGIVSCESVLSSYTSLFRGRGKGRTATPWFNCQYIRMFRKAN